MSERLYSLLEVKAIDADRREFTGTASHSSLDRVGDRVLTDHHNVKFTLPVPVLMHHRHDLPVGHIVAATPGRDGIAITGRIAKPDNAEGVLAQRCQEAIDSLRSGVIRGLSIGFLPLESKPIRDAKGLTTGREWTLWEWTETSLVVCPANVNCTVHTIKSLDEAAMHAAAAETSQHPEVRRIRLLMQAIGPVIKRYVGDQIAPLQAENAALRERLAALEPMADLSSLHAELRELRSMKGLTWRGTWKEGEAYAKHDICQRSGASWIAIADKPGKPGDGDKETSGWQLMNKGGRDGLSVYESMRRAGLTDLSEREWLQSLAKSTESRMHSGTATPRDSR